jgi:hypothetical protein
MICCGKKRNTKFCPDCGCRLTNSLVGLLKHVEGKAELVRKRYEGVKQRSLSDRPKWETSLPSLLKTVEKWESWRDLLAKLLESRGDET